MENISKFIPKVFILVSIVKTNMDNGLYKVSARMPENMTGFSFPNSALDYLLVFWGGSSGSQPSQVESSRNVAPKKCGGLVDSVMNFLPNITRMEKIVEGAPRVMPCKELDRDFEHGRNVYGYPFK